MIKWIVRGLIGLIGLFVLIQFVPYGRDHTNPPVIEEPAWDSERTRALAVRACYDCHSNETRWLWFHNIAPISWGVQRDVEEGRATLNFSEWNREQEEAEEAAEVVAEGSMPPVQYLIAHPEAQLSAAEEQALVQGLLATFGGKEEGNERREEAAEREEALEATEEAAERAEEAREEALEATEEAQKALD